MLQDISSHLQTPLISDVLYLRLFIMYMHMRHLCVRERLKTDRKSM